MELRLKSRQRGSRTQLSALLCCLTSMGFSPNQSVGRGDRVVLIHLVLEDENISFHFCLFIYSSFAVFTPLTSSSSNRFLVHELYTAISHSSGSLWTSSVISGPISDPWNWNPQLSKIPGWFKCTLNCETHWSSNIYPPFFDIHWFIDV